MKIITRRQHGKIEFSWIHFTISYIYFYFFFLPISNPFITKTSLYPLNTQRSFLFLSIFLLWSLSLHAFNLLLPPIFSYPNPFHLLQPLRLVGALPPNSRGLINDLKGGKNRMKSYRKEPYLGMRNHTPWPLICPFSFLLFLTFVSMHQQQEWPTNSPIKMNER